MAIAGGGGWILSNRCRFDPETGRLVFIGGYSQLKPKSVVPFYHKSERRGKEGELLEPAKNVRLAECVTRLLRGESVMIDVRYTYTSAILAEIERGRKRARAEERAFLLLVDEVALANRRDPYERAVLSEMKRSWEEMG